MNAPLDAGLASALATLGLRPDADARAVRRAYALQLKQIDQATQLPEFQALREAYEFALAGIAHREAAAAQAEAATAAHDDANEPPVVASAPDAAPPADDHLPAVEAPALPTAGALADAVFQTFAARAAAAFANEDEATAALAQALADERLLNLEARTIFEWQVAHLIMAGWRPGHEFLFGPACQAFGWEQDRAHLRIFGQLGAALDAAINEKLMFFQQSPQAFEVQRNVIRRLRSEKPPSATLLREDLHWVHLLVQRYPNWLRLVTSQENINSWFRDLPDTEPSAPLVPVEANFPSAPKPRSVLPWLLPVLVLLMVVISALNGPRTPRPTPAQQTPPWARIQPQGPGSTSPYPPSVLGPNTPDLGLDPPKSPPAPLYPGLSSPPAARPASADQPAAAGAQYAFLGPVTFARTPKRITVDEVEARSTHGRSTLRPGDELQGCAHVDKGIPLTLALDRGACGNIRNVDPQTGIVSYVFHVLRNGQATTAAIVMPPPDRKAPDLSNKNVEDALKAATTIAAPLMQPTPHSQPAPAPAAPAPRGDGDETVHLGHVTFQQRDTAVVVATVSERSARSFGTLQAGDIVMGCMAGEYRQPLTHVSEVRQCVVTNPPPQDKNSTPYMFRVLREGRSQPASLTLRQLDAPAAPASRVQFGSAT